MSDLDNLIPSSGRITWNEADFVVGVADGGNVSSVPGKSAGDKTLACASTYPVLQTNIINGLPVVDFDGTKNPLAYTGAVTPKHIIVLAAHQDAAFPSGDNGYGGLLTGVTSAWSDNNILVGGGPTTTKFFDFTLGLTYKKRDVAFAESDMQAAFNNAISIFEVSLAGGFGMDGIQIGKQRAVSPARLWKGYWAALFMWNRVLTANETADVYEYIACRYRIWRLSSGLNVWPFSPNWSLPGSFAPRELSSSSVSGATKTRTKSSGKNAYELRFETRHIDEFEAAKAFRDANTSFVFRDYGYATPRDTTMRFTSGIDLQRNDYNDVDYSFQAVEV